MSTISNKQNMLSSKIKTEIIYIKKRKKRTHLLFNPLIIIKKLMEYQNLNNLPFYL